MGTLNANLLTWLEMHGNQSDTDAQKIHSVHIGDKDTWTDWHLVPTERPYVVPPAVKTQIIEIPGSNYDLDYTQALDGRVHYHNRKGTWKFIAIPDGTSMISRYNTVLNYIQGKWLAVQIADDLGYFVGRLWIKKWKSEQKYATVEIEYNLQPTKGETNEVL